MRRAEQDIFKFDRAFTRVEFEAMEAPLEALPSVPSAPNVTPPAATVTFASHKKNSAPPCFSVNERVNVLPGKTPDAADDSVPRRGGSVEFWTCRNSWCTVLMDDTGKAEKVRPRRLEDAVTGVRRWVVAKAAKDALVVHRLPKGPKGSKASKRRSGKAIGGPAPRTKRQRAMEEASKTRTKKPKLMQIAELLVLEPWRGHRAAVLDREHLITLSECTEFHSDHRWPALPRKTRGAGGVSHKKKSHKKSHKKKQPGASALPPPRSYKPRVRAESDEDRRRERSYAPQQPKKPIAAYTSFVVHRRTSGAEPDDPCDFKSMAKKIGAEWKALDAAARKPFLKIAALDKERYARDVKAYRAALTIPTALTGESAALPVGAAAAPATVPAMAAPAVSLAAAAPAVAAPAAAVPAWTPSAVPAAVPAAGVVSAKRPRSEESAAATVAHAAAANRARGDHEAPAPAPAGAALAVPQAHKRSKYSGVSWHKRDRRWQASVRSKSGKVYNKGFKAERDALEWRNGIIDERFEGADALKRKQPWSGETGLGDIDRQIAARVAKEKEKVAAAAQRKSARDSQREYWSNL